MEDEDIRFENIYKSMDEKEDNQTKKLLNKHDTPPVDIFWCCNIFNWVFN